MAYATFADLQARTEKTLEGKEALCEALLQDASIIIDAYNAEASEEAKKVVSCRIVLRAIGTDNDIPIGASQGTMSALGYSQTWTLGGSGTVGELYLSKLDKKLLGSSKIGSYSPVEGL